MGRYTGLRFIAKLNSNGLEAIKIMNAFRMVENSEEFRASELFPVWYVFGGCDYWDPVREMLDLPEEWMEDTRTNLIPYGHLVYMPDNWEHANHVDEEGRWHVCCSLKNSTDTIGKFLEHVLPKMISEKCVAESMYEESQPIEHLVCPAEM